MLSPAEFGRQCDARDRAAKTAALTPQHAAAEGAMDGGDNEEDQEDQAGTTRDRVRHLVDPYPPDVPEVAHADLDKAFRQALDTPEGYPQFGHVSPEAFRRGPVTAGEAAYGPAYVQPARPVPVPSSTLSASAITRPLITDGQAVPSAERC